MTVVGALCGAAVVIRLCRYFQITSEVLTSVKRTEDSLSKLKRKRQSVAPVSGGMSDDNKIRLQLALDIEEYIAQVHIMCCSPRPLTCITMQA